MYSCLLRSVSGMSLLHDLLGEALDDGCLADAGLADEHRVVLGATAEDLHDSLELAAATDHRVELLLASELCEVATELVEDLAVALVAGSVFLALLARCGCLRLALALRAALVAADSNWMTCWRTRRGLRRA